MAGASVVGTGLSIMGRLSSASDASSNRAAALNTALNTTIPSINQSLGQIYNANSGREIQERDKAATEAFDINRQMADAKGAATAAAGDAGVGGVSFSNILSDFEMREGLAAGKRNYNYATKVQSIADENQAQQERARGTINQVINQAVASTPVPSPMSTYMGIGADVAGAGLKIADKYGLFDLSKDKVDPATGNTIPKS